MEHNGSGLLDPALWLAIGGGLGIGLLIGLERERNPAGKAGVRTFALVSLLGTLAGVSDSIAVLQKDGARDVLLMHPETETEGG